MEFETPYPAEFKKLFLKNKFLYSKNKARIMIDSGFIFNLYHCFIDDAYRMVVHLFYP